MTLNCILNDCSQLLIKLAQHIYLAGISTVIAICIGLPVGIWIFYRPRMRGFILGITSVFQTIPSLALLAFLIPFLGIGTKPTLVTLTIYGLLPIVRNTLVGIQEIPASSREAARALGFHTWQRIRLVEVPLALPTIISGIRTASAMNIGIATIAAFIGAGGLGDFITEGLSLNSNQMILMGAIPAAILALVVDYLIGQVEMLSAFRTRQRMHWRRTKIALVSIAGLAFIAIIIQQNWRFFSGNHVKPIVVSSKNFSEQYILANIMADMLRAYTNLPIVIQDNLSSSVIAQEALQTGAIDTYPDYSGTIYMNILHQTNIVSAKQTYQYVKKYSAKHLGILWLKPFGFENTTAIAVTNAFAKAHHLTTLSQLAQYGPMLTMAAPPEFLKRVDAYAALQKYYGVHFKKIVTMTPSLMYRAIANHQVDAILSFGTDGWLQALKLTALIDDKHIYPPYQAVPLANAAAVKKYPQIATALNRLHNQITVDDMKRMNYQVDVKQIDPAVVAKKFLISRHLIPQNPSSN
ncbi:MAG: glycine betaine ABC transporter substrate-binding protein [Coxiellaceae bacterium]|nr:glycine betaine ABC transporter substrate-binding protein [Coxiellaceae bacterium]